tara:strand:+ start:1636 stop:1926 length:291 start_codon:yes stop_codon:yes gene_type:complete
MFNITQQQKDDILKCYDKAKQYDVSSNTNPSNWNNTQTVTRKVFNDIIDDYNWVTDLKVKHNLDGDKANWDIVGNRLWDLVADPTRQFAKGQAVNQ